MLLKIPMRRSDFFCEHSNFGSNGFYVVLCELSFSNFSFDMFVICKGFKYSNFCVIFELDGAFACMLCVVCDA